MKKTCCNNLCTVRHLCTKAEHTNKIGKEKFALYEGGRECSGFDKKETIAGKLLAFTASELRKHEQNQTNEANFGIIYDAWLQIFKETGEKRDRKFFIFEKLNGIASLPVLFVYEKTNELKLYD